MTHEIVVKRKDGNWQIGTIDGISFTAKVYDEPSEEFGIEGGNISKLWIKDILNYDRGWDRRPKSKTEKDMLRSLLNYFDPRGKAN